MKIQDIPHDKLLTAAQVAVRLGLAIGTIRNLTCQGRLPAAVKLGAQTIRWRESDVDKIVRGECAMPSVETARVGKKK